MHGMNLLEINSDQTTTPFIDLMETRRPWEKAAVGATGWPTSTGKAAAQTYIALPFGEREYTAIIKGNVTAMRLRGGPVVVPKNGVATFKVNVAIDPAAGIFNPVSSVMLDFTGDVSFTLCETRMLPWLAAGKIFRPEYVALVQPWPVLRFMDWLETNEKELLPNRRAREAAMLCNLSGAKVMWWNRHHLQDDAAFIAEVLDILEVLNPDILLLIEPSNEVWGMANVYAWAAAQGNVDEVYGRWAASMSKLLARVTSRAKLALCSMFVMPDRWAKILAAYSAAGGIRSMIYGLFAAPYYGWSDAKGAAPWVEFAKKDDAAGAVGWLGEKVKANIPLFARHAKYAADLGVPFGAYEHQAHTPMRAPIVADTALRDKIVVPFTRKVIQSAEVGALSRQNVDNARAGGWRGPMCFFNLAGQGSQSGVWGAYPSDAEMTGFPVVPAVSGR
jgi:hypothetical protein